MAEGLLKRIRDLDDFRVVRFYQHFAQRLFDEVDIDLDQILPHVPEELKTSSELTPLLNLAGPGRRNAMTFEAGALCARETLLALGRHPGFHDALNQALDEYTDDAMVADVILAVGLAASMIIVAATTRFRVRFSEGKLEGEFGKEVASQEMVSDIVGHLAAAAQKVGAAGVG